MQSKKKATLAVIKFKYIFFPDSNISFIYVILPPNIEKTINPQGGTLYIAKKLLISNNSNVVYYIL